MNNLFDLLQKWSWLLFTVALVSTLLGCGAKKKLTLKDDEKPLSAAKVYKNLLANRKDFKGIDGQGKFKFQDDYLSISGTFNLKSKKDSCIWVRVKKFGFEAARVFITKDSFFLINRLERTYSALPLNYLESKYQVPASFEDLQDLLWGNAPSVKPELLTLSRMTTDSIQLNYQESQYVSSFMINALTYDITEVNLWDKRKPGQFVAFGYEGYKPVNAEDNFSYIRLIRLFAEATGKVNFDLQFSNINFEVPKDIRFEIPSRYDKADF